MTSNEKYMQLALKEAQKAYNKNETPIGAIIVFQDKVIARAYNQRESKQNSVAHAEILAIQKACKKIGSWRLEDCSLYVTLEPCVMCSGAIIQSRIKKVFYGAKNNRYGCHQGVINLFDISFNHQVEVISGILEEDCSNMITSFFKDLRRDKSN